MENEVAASLATLLSKMESFVSSKTVVGTPVNIEGIIIVPLVDVVVGVGAGGSNNSNNDKNASGGSGGGLGAKITPSAVLVINNDGVQLVNVKNQDSINKLIDMVPGILSKFNLGKKDGKEEKDAVAEPVEPKKEIIIE